MIVQRLTSILLGVVVVKYGACHCVTPGHIMTTAALSTCLFKMDNDWVDLGRFIRQRLVSNERLDRVETPGGNMQLSTLQLVLLRKVVFLFQYQCWMYYHVDAATRS